MPELESLLNDKVKKVFIGITGLLGTGKSTLVAVLTDLALQHDIQVLQYSLSEEIRSILSDFAARRTEQIHLSAMLKKKLTEDLHADNLLNRENLIQVANDLRKNYGNGVLAQRILRQIRQDLITSSHPQVLVIIDSIRNPGEVSEFRWHLKDRFKLIAIEASSEKIEARLLSRRRIDESLAMKLHHDEAVMGLLRQDKGIGEPIHGLQVEACVQMADWRLFNDGTVSEFKRTTREFADKLIMPSLGIGMTKNGLT